METLYRSSSRKGEQFKGWEGGGDNPESQGPNVITQMGADFFTPNENLEMYLNFRGSQGSPIPI